MRGRRWQGSVGFGRKCGHTCCLISFESPGSNVVLRRTASRTFWLCSMWFAVMSVEKNSLEGGVEALRSAEAVGSLDDMTGHEYERLLGGALCCLGVMSHTVCPSARDVGWLVASRSVAAGCARLASPFFGGVLAGNIAFGILHLPCHLVELRTCFESNGNEGYKTTALAIHTSRRWMSKQKREGNRSTAS